MSSGPQIDHISDPERQRADSVAMARSNRHNSSSEAHLYKEYMEKIIDILIEQCDDSAHQVELSVTEQVLIRMATEAIVSMYEIST